MYWILHILAMIAVSTYLFGGYSKFTMDEVRDAIDLVIDSDEFDHVEASKKNWVRRNLITVLHVLIVLIPWIPLGMIIYALMDNDK